MQIGGWWVTLCSMSVKSDSSLVSATPLGKPLVGVALLWARLEQEGVSGGGATQPDSMCGLWGLSPRWGGRGKRETAGVEASLFAERCNFFHTSSWSGILQECCLQLLCDEGLHLLVKTHCPA